MKEKQIDIKFEKIKGEILERLQVLNKVEAAGRLMGVPFPYSDASAFMVFFPISFKEAERIINNKRLKPVKIFRNTTVVGITIFSYRDCPIGPFNEFTISIPVMINSWLDIPLIPLVFDSRFNNFGFHVIMLGVNSDLAREHIINLFGYPTLDRNIDIDLEERDGFLNAKLSEHSKEIMSFRKILPKKLKLVRKEFNTFYEMKGNIYRVKLDTVLKMSKSSNNRDLISNFGGHEITQILKNLNIKKFPIQSIYYKKAVEVAGGPELI